MSAEVLVSIIIPYYNNSTTIGATLMSIRKQTYKLIEIILIDDGSLQSISDDIKAEFKDLNIKYYVTENRGASAARNLGFKYSSGDYIQYLDADDLLSEQKFEHQINLLKDRNNAVAICKWATFTDSINESKPHSYLLYKNWSALDYVIVLNSNFSEIMPIHAYLIPRHLVLHSRGWNEQLTAGDDGEFMVRILLQTEHVLFDNSSYVYYRRSNPSSLSSSRDYKTYMSVLECCRSYRDEILKVLSFEDAKYSIHFKYSLLYHFSYNSTKEVALEGLRDLEKLGINKILPIGKKALLFQKVLGTKNYLFLKSIFNH